jgi:hypothetical protein
MAGFQCRWQSSENCHSTKKNSLVCTACWNGANEEKQETYKRLETKYDWCQSFGCFEIPDLFQPLCKFHMAHPPNKVPNVPAAQTLPLSPPREQCQPRSKASKRQRSISSSSSSALPCWGTPQEAEPETPASAIALADDAAWPAMLATLSLDELARLSHLVLVELESRARS